MDSERVLVIILAITLTVFLVAATVVMFKLTVVLNRVKKIADYGEKIGESAESIVRILKSGAAPIAAGKVISGLFKTVKRSKSKKGKL